MYKYKYKYGDLTTISPTIISTKHCISTMNIEFHPSGTPVRAAYGRAARVRYPTWRLPDVARYRSPTNMLQLGWHCLSNATCLVRPHLFSTALLVKYG